MMIGQRGEKGLLYVGRPDSDNNSHDMTDDICIELDYRFYTIL